MNEQRPNPDELLNKLLRQEQQQRRGRLKIFFGACAGVGKTFAMLLAAQTLKEQNVDVVVGLIETHGRPETAALLKGLEILTPKIIEYHGKLLPEFDIDSALSRKPRLILIDELAHTNVKGSRHAKRWQDVEELLAAGIDVYTTVNVQHIESLNDVVNHITGIRIHETFPDRIFDNVDEITLVDLPPDELLDRLKSGKVYISEQIKYAVTNFFRKGNLIALRELALRRMADRVDVQMREYRADQYIQRVWQTKERVLVCVGPQESSENLIRKAYRLATNLRADWLAVYVETPALQKLSKSKREQILKNLKLAQELGAETNVLDGTDIPQVLISYARSRNVSKIIVGQPPKKRWLRLRRSTLAEQLINQMVDIDIYIVRSDLESSVPEPSASVTLLEFEEVPKSRWRAYAYPSLVLAAITGISWGLAYFSNLPAIALLYLWGDMLIAKYWGRLPALVSSLISVVLFDYFFIPPSWSFYVADSRYIITLAVMLLMALVVSNTIANIRYQARVASYRERRTNAVYALSKELSTALTVPQISEISLRHLSAVFQVKVFLLLPDSHNKVHLLIQASQQITDPNLCCDSSIAQWSYDHHEPAGLGTQTLPSSVLLYLPLQAPMGTRGVLAILPQNPQKIYLPEQKRLLDIFAAQIALALEHIHYVEIARDALLSMESERVRNSLISAISRNLRAPLNDILGLTEILINDDILTENSRRELIHEVYKKSVYVSNLITTVWGV